jgi:hypothetical protein
MGFVCIVYYGLAGADDDDGCARHQCSRHTYLPNKYQDPLERAELLGVAHQIRGALLQAPQRVADPFHDPAQHRHGQVGPVARDAVTAPQAAAILLPLLLLGTAAGVDGDLGSVVVVVVVVSVSVCPCRKGLKVLFE